MVAFERSGSGTLKEVNFCRPETDGTLGYGPSLNSDGPATQVETNFVDASARNWAQLPVNDLNERVT